jgi:sporulation protein YunB
MLRNSTIYRRLWYVRKRNLNKLNIMFKVIIAVLMITAVTTDRLILPSLTHIAEQQAKDRFECTVNTVVRENLSSEVRYEDLVSIARDTDGNVTSLHIDMMKLNYFSSHISQKIREELSRDFYGSFSVPLGKLAGVDALSEEGPCLKMPISSAGDIRASFDSVFTSDGTNRTRHTVFLLVEAYFDISVPMKKIQIGLSSRVPVIDALIIGKLPVDML